jgi:regulatory protein
LNEERYARAYAHDHHAFKNWGKQKIKQGLFRKGISKALIALALQDIPDEDEQENMRILAKRKWESLAKDTIIKRKGKVMRYLFNKGFDAEQIQKAIRILAGADDE